MTQIYLRQAQLADRDTIMQIIADAKAERSAGYS